MNISNKILDDYENYCTAQLQSEFGQYQPSSYDAIYLYQRYKCRIIMQRVREVRLPQNLIIPPQHLAAYQEIVSDIVGGNSLKKYQSRKLKDLHCDDDMLSHWGIQHLHLGRILEQDGFVKRTGDLLFVHFTKQYAHILGIFDHSSWCNLDLIEIIHTNWPDQLVVYEKNSNATISGAEIAASRKRNMSCNVVVSDGTEYFVPGLGVTSNGAPINAVLNSQNVIQMFNAEFDLIKSNISQILSADSQKRISENITVGLTMDDVSKRFVYVIQETGFKFTIPS
jgi:hypothetical protein